jgi:hypothetical protein
LWHKKDHRDGGFNISVRNSIGVNLHRSSDLFDAFRTLHMSRDINSTFFLSNLRQNNFLGSNNMIFILLCVHSTSSRRGWTFNGLEDGATSGRQKRIF